MSLDSIRIPCMQIHPIIDFNVHILLYPHVKAQYNPLCGQTQKKYSFWILHLAFVIFDKHVPRSSGLFCDGNIRCRKNDLGKLEHLRAVVPAFQRRPSKVERFETP